MPEQSVPRPRPCASCPYRQDVPSGVWDESEYVRLCQYDGSIAEQAMNGGMAAFGCHQADGYLCSGWVGHRDEPGDLLAIRIGILQGTTDPSVVDYITTVPLFASGAEAAAHGMRDIEAPSDKAKATVEKLNRHVPGLHFKEGSE